MKTQQETTIQFSGYPLRVVHEEHKPLVPELVLVKATSTAPPSSGAQLANNPQNWDIDWFNSYE